jgi:hypothetical protein
MAQNYPLTASGSREPTKPQPIPRAVRQAIKLMVYGDPDDPDGRPLPFIEAGKACGVKPDTMRRYLHRPNVCALLRAERRLFREAINAGNEGALMRIRDKSPNGMAVIGSVRALEQLDDADSTARLGAGVRPPPGLIVVVNTLAPAPRVVEPDAAVRSIVDVTSPHRHVAGRRGGSEPGSR